MSAGHVDRWLPAYSLGVLGEDEARRVDVHLADCAACRAALEALLDVDEEEDEDAAIDPHLPADVLARWDRVGPTLRGLEAELYAAHLESCAACRADLASVRGETAARGPVAFPTMADAKILRPASGWRRTLRAPTYWIPGGLAAAASLALLVSRLAVSPVGQVAVQPAGPGSDSTHVAVRPDSSDIPAPQIAAVPPQDAIPEDRGRPLTPRDPGSPGRGTPARVAAVDLRVQVAASLRQPLGDIEQSLVQRVAAGSTIAGSEGSESARYEAYVSIDTAAAASPGSGSGGRAGDPSIAPPGSIATTTPTAGRGRVRVRILDRWTGQLLRENSAPIDSLRRDGALERVAGWIDDAIALQPWAGTIRSVRGDTLVIAGSGSPVPTVGALLVLSEVGATSRVGGTGEPRGVVLTPVARGRVASKDGSTVRAIVLENGMNVRLGLRVRSVGEN